MPGSKVPVYLVGAKMTDYYPLSIVVHGVALNITVQSHVDKICFGLIACRRAVPDVHELGQQVERAMALLRKLRGRAGARGRVGVAGTAQPLRSRRRRQAPARTARAGPPRSRAAARKSPGASRRTCAPRRGSGCPPPSASRNGAPLNQDPMRLVADVLVGAGGAAAPLVPGPRDVPLGQAARPEDLPPDARGTRPRSKVLAANQGLYGGFLAAGLLWGLLARRGAGFDIKVFFLACVVVAGLYGAATVGGRSCSCRRCRR